MDDNIEKENEEASTPEGRNALDTLKLLSRFWRAPRRKGVTPAENSVITVLLSLGADLKPAKISHQTLAEWTCFDIRTVAKALDSLSRKGWVSPKRAKGQATQYMVNLKPVKLADSSLTIIPGEDAVELVEHFTNRWLREMPQGRWRRDPRPEWMRAKVPSKNWRPDKKWKKQQEFSAQRILNKCNGNLRYACTLIDHAFSSTPTFKRCAVASLYNVNRKLEGIEAHYILSQTQEYTEKQRQKERIAESSAAIDEMLVQ